MLQPLLPGTPGDELEPDTHERMWRSIGQEMRRIHGVPVGGYGETVQAMTAGGKAGWREYLAYNLGELTDRDPLLPLGLLDRDAQAQLRERFTDLTRGPTRLGLCHGDLSLKNVIVDDGSVQVIDYTAGKLDLIGLSNATRADVETALELVDVAGVQNAYSILDRTHDDVIELCRDRKMAFVPFFPLGYAFTGGPKKLAADPHIAQTAAKHESPPPRSRSPGCSNRYDRMLLIPGTTSVAHLEENLAAADLALDDEDLETLERVEPVGHPLG